MNEALTNNTPDSGELAKETSLNQDTSQKQPSTPKTSKKIIVLTPKPTVKNSPFKNPSGKLQIKKRATKGKTFDTSFPEGPGKLPLLSERKDVLVGYTKKDLQKMTKNQDIKIKGKFKLNKDELISEIKQQLKEDS